MKIQHVFLYQENNCKQFTASAKISVPGLGDVEIKSALPEELCEQVTAACAVALKVKLGQILTADLEEPCTCISTRTYEKGICTTCGGREA